MQNFMKTIISAVQTWTTGKIKDSIKNSVADWNENDSSKDSYIKNRTHWTDLDGTVHKLDSKYLNLPTNIATTDDVQGALDVANAVQSTADAKMDKENPVGTGSFSMNRKANTTIGNYSHAEGSNTTASGKYSHAEGWGTVASGTSSHAEGYNTTASGNYSHAEGHVTIASGYYSHTEGNGTTASHYYAHAEGNNTTASGVTSHAEGDGTTASGESAHAEGYYTTANVKSQHVQGKYNILDTVSYGDGRGKYAHIVGNGTSDTARSNAHTLDWDGNAWYQGEVYVGGTSQDDGEKLVKESVLAGCWISFTDENGNPTTEPYIHWYEE